MAIAKLSSDEHPVGLAEVSRHCGLSRRYLEQLVPPLKNALLLRSLSGRGGGYSLAKEATDIKVSEIIEAAIGPIAVTECAVEADICIHSDFCSCRHLWALVNHRINQVLHEYSLADLLDRHWASRVQKEIKGAFRNRTENHSPNTTPEVK